MGQLLKNVLHNATSQAASIQLEVHEKNLKALKIYNQVGFKHVGTRKNYYKDGGAALLMTFSKPSSPR